METEKALEQIKLTARYFLSPVKVENLADFEKGIERGRAEGLIMAYNLLTTGETIKGVKGLEDVDTQT